MTARLVVPKWERFQHPDATKGGRVPPWIKTWTRLLSDDAYLALSGHRRAVLHGLWLEYARAGAQLPADTAALARRLSLRVTAADLDALREAGFIEFGGDARSAEAKRAVSRRAVDNPVDSAVDGCGEARSRAGHELVTIRSRAGHADTASAQPCDLAPIPSGLEESRGERPLLVAVALGDGEGPTTTRTDSGEGTGRSLALAGVTA